MRKKINKIEDIENKDSVKNTENTNKELINYKTPYTIAVKSLFCLIALSVLLIILQYKPAVNNIVSITYFIFSTVATSILIILLPFVLAYDFNNKKRLILVRIAYEICDFFLAFIITCVAIQSFFVFGYFRAEVQGSSMLNTFTEGDALIVESTTEVNNFDIVVVTYNKELNHEIQNYYEVKDKERLIKRLIGKGGDTISFVDGKLYLNYKLVDEKYNNGYWFSNFDLSDHLGYGVLERINETTNSKEYYIQEGYYFVLGDNRNISLDSEELGLFQKSQLLGKVVYRINSIFDWEKIA